MAYNTGTIFENKADGYLAEASQIKGGYKVVATAPTSAGKDTVSGSLCYCTGDSKFYMYNGSSWVVKKFVIGDLPSEYIKSASTNNNTLTLTNKDDTTVTFTPTFTNTWSMVVSTGDEAISDGTNTLNVVTKDTNQTISGVKIFTASNKFSSETKFVHDTYCPDWTDIASGIGKSSCFTRGAFMQMITGQILLPNNACTDNDKGYNTVANTLKFQTMTASAGQPVVTTVAEVKSDGLYSNGIKVATTSDLGSYLPLTAGSGSPVTGDLYVKSSNDEKSLYLGKDGRIRVNSSGTMIISTNANGNGGLYFRAGGNTTTTNSVALASNSLISETNASVSLGATTHRWNGTYSTTYYVGPANGTAKIAYNSSDNSIEFQF